LTWQVAHDCCPEAERLLSLNSASPATAAAESGWTAGGGTSAELLPPLHAESVAIAAAMTATGASA